MPIISGYKIIIIIFEAWQKSNNQIKTIYSYVIKKYVRPMLKKTQQILFEMQKKVRLFEEMYHRNINPPQINLHVFRNSNKNPTSLKNCTVWEH